MVYIKELDPLRATFSDALNVCDILLESYSDVAGFQYCWGDQWLPKSILEIRHSITDPRKRLREYHRNAKNQVLGRKISAANLMTGFTVPGSICYLALEPNPHTGTEQIVGVMTWALPKHMQNEYETKVGRVGMWWRIKAFFQRLYYQLYQRWLLLTWTGFAESPISNVRIDKVRKSLNKETYEKHESTVDQLLIMDQKELQSAVYPRSSMVYLFDLVISPTYQRRGIGSQLFSHAFQSIPNVPTPFEGANGDIVYGPQKMHLRATAEGRGLYIKKGFVPIEEHVFEDGGYKVESTIMLKTR